MSVEDSRKKIDNWLVDRVFTLHHDWLTDFQNKKIDYWRIDRVLISYHDWLTVIQNKKINYWLSFSQTHDHSRWLTMRQVKVRYIHRSQRRNLFINADSRSFSLTHDTSSESEMQSSLSKKKLSFREDSFCSVASLTKIRSVVSWSISKRTSHFDDFILLTRVFRRAICFKAKRLIECQLISQNSKREIVLKTWRWFRHHHWRKLRWRRHRCKLIRFCFFLLANRLRVWSLHRSSRWRSNIMSKNVFD